MSPGAKWGDLQQDRSPASLHDSNPYLRGLYLKHYVVNTELKVDTKFLNNTKFSFSSLAFVTFIRNAKRLERPENLTVWYKDTSLQTLRGHRYIAVENYACMFFQQIPRFLFLRSPSNVSDNWRPSSKSRSNLSQMNTT
jgi:hypothetical protein